MLYRIILGIHAYGMFAALLMFVARELLLIPARKGWIGPAKAALHFSRFAGIAATIGVLAGITLFFLGGWPLAPWLMASLALIAMLMVVERNMLGSWQERAKTIFEGIASDREVRALARDPRALLGRLIVVGLFGLIALLMTIKPPLNF